MDPIDGTSPESNARRVNAPDVYCVPWSLWITTPSAWRFSIAIPSAFTTRLAVWDESIDQPTTRRENASSTTAVHLALAGAVLGDVSQPQPVRLGPREVAVHEICRC